MDRILVYPTQVPLDTMFLDTNKNGMVGLGKLAESILGTGTLADGLQVTPTTVPSLAVTVSPGAIYSQQNIDGTAYSSLPADTAHQVVKQGLLPDAVTLATPAPATAGQSVIYLIQAAYGDQDALPVVLPYYNAANPTVSWSGPNNSGTQQNTVRRGVCVVGAKAGVASATPTAPAPDVGYVGLYTVTVANGQSTVAAVNIAQLSTAPLLSEKLTAKISKPTADSYYAPAHGQCRLALSGGNIVLSPYNGNKLVVNGVMRTVPSGGLSLSPSGMTVGAAFGVYAAVTAGALALEFGTLAGHAPDAATGVEVKAGDATRTLVGQAAKLADGTILVSSHFNRGLIDRSTSLYSGNTTATSGTELTASARAYFLTWADEAVQMTVSGVVANSISGNINYLNASLDNATTFGRTAPVVTPSSGVVGYGSAPGSGNIGEGLHLLTPYVYVTGGTGSYSNVAINLVVRG